ncbi:hypothetical protein ACHHYP_11949, partial [Achlya hypogyna]
MAPTTFAVVRAQLQSTAEYEQSDASALIFEHWYDLAKDYTASYTPEGTTRAVASVTHVVGIPQMQQDTLLALDLTLTSYLPARLRDPSTTCTLSGTQVLSRGVIPCGRRELLRNAQKIFETLRTKYKFTAVVAADDARNPLAEWLVATGGPALEAITLSETAPAAARVDAFDTYAELLRLWAVLATQDAAPPALPTAAFVQVAASLTTDAAVRDAALHAARALTPLAAPGTVATALARVARDALALVPLWAMDALGTPPALDALLGRMRAAFADQTPARAAFCVTLLESLYEALLNHKTSRDLFLTPAHEPALVQLFATALATFQRLPTDGARRVLPDVFLQTVELRLLEAASPLLVRFALDADEYALLCVIGRTCHAFPDALWTDELLPFARSELAKLPLQGVSGSQRDQEVVNLVREACRLYYLNIDRVPSVLLGQSVFFSVTQAIRHGYYETERFTELLALVMHRHYSLGHRQVYQWLPSLLLPTVASNLKTGRALSEALGICLGLETSAFGCENAILASETSQE